MSFQTQEAWPSKDASWDCGPMAGNSSVVPLAGLGYLVERMCRSPKRQEVHGNRGLHRLEDARHIRHGT